MNPNDEYAAEADAEAQAQYEAEQQAQAEHAEAMEVLDGDGTGAQVEAQEGVLDRAIAKAKVNGFVLDHSIWGYRHIIFDHDFAKAFWGTDRTHAVTERSFDNASGRLSRGSITYPISDWQYHLQQMVLFENPLDYIQRFLHEEANEQ